MIEGFENTSELTEEEEWLMHKMVKWLQPKINKQNAVSARQMVKGMRAQGYNITEVRIRKIIHEIRVRGLVKCLVAGGRGYYITVDMREGEAYIRSLTQRINSIEAIRKAMVDQFAEYYSPRLFKD